MKSFRGDPALVVSMEGRVVAGAAARKADPVHDRYSPDRHRLSTVVVLDINVVRRAMVAAVAAVALSGCAEDEPAAEKAPVPVESLSQPLPTGAAGSDKLARLIERNLRANNPKAQDPVVSCDPVEEVAQGVEVACEVCFGSFTQLNNLRVRFTDGTGNFEYGPGKPGA